MMATAHRMNATFVQQCCGLPKTGAAFSDKERNLSKKKDAKCANTRALIGYMKVRGRCEEICVWGGFQETTSLSAQLRNV